MNDDEGASGDHAPSSSIKPHNTAIHRKRPSQPAANLISTGQLELWGVRSILDYGCGHGLDVRHLKALGYEAEGYDPHPEFKHTTHPVRQFDLVLVLYVLNVLSTEQERLDVLRGAARCMAAAGRMLVVARSVSEIERAAKDWPRHNDGYLSNADRGMFQHGMTRQELIDLAAAASLRPAEETMQKGRGGVGLLLVRNAAG